ncbi:unnamed protein product [Pylaiella littoralis]
MMEAAAAGRNRPCSGRRFVSQALVGFGLLPRTAGGLPLLPSTPVVAFGPAPMLLVAAVSTASATTSRPYPRQVRQQQRQRGSGRRVFASVQMSGGETPYSRAGFLKNGLAVLLGTVAVASASPVVAEDFFSDELDEETKEKITQALMEALEGMEGIELSPGEGGGGKAAAAPPKDVLKASADVLPHRTPFEMEYELFKRGMELEESDNYLGAEKQWTEIIENFNSPNFRSTNPGNKVLLARAYNNRGNTRLSLQKTREAILDYSESIDLVPEKGEFWLARGVAFEDMADRKVLALADRNVEVARTFYESALADYDHAVVLDPQDPRVYVSRGDANTLLGQGRNALDNYARAVSLSPMTPEFRAKVALAELQLGHKQRGAFLIGQLLQRYPSYPEMLLAGAAVAWGDGDLVESQQMYAEAVRLDERLMDEDFIWLILRWPEQPLGMVKAIRSASSAPKGSGLEALGLKSLLSVPREVI